MDKAILEAEIVKIVGVSKEFGTNYKLEGRKGR